MRQQRNANDEVDINIDFDFVISSVMKSASIESNLDDFENVVDFDE